ncbi:hypothetical protein QYB46_001674 [Clostridium perfringens]|nr:hypothetical protein [Clostridium perfringens]EIF6167615.1 hypothetical protein [Clostridium perfringens]ELC8395808.1 hypothetical protein [Clostridium perfringens]MDM0635098.1 hypothetical protein [Clostridium perfringens]
MEKIDEGFSVNHNTIELYEKSVTLFYSLKTGDIRLYAGGKQDMSYFGKEKDDYNYGYIVVEKNDFLLNNLENFKVIDGELQLKEDLFISKYMR